MKAIFAVMYRRSPITVYPTHHSTQHQKVKRETQIRYLNLPRQKYYKGQTEKRSVKKQRKIHERKTKLRENTTTTVKKNYGKIMK